MILRFLKYIFIEDYIAKLICLAIGSALWFYVEFARVTQVTLNIPVEYVKKPANLFLKQGQARFVKITVRGREEFIKFPTTGIRAEINLANARSGEAKFPLIFDARQLPERVEVAQKPESLVVGLEKGATKIVPVKIALSGNVDAALRVQKIATDPAQVEIEGPEQLINSLTGLDTESIDIEGLAKNLKTKAELRIPDQVFTDNVKTIDVRIDLVAKAFSEVAPLEGVPLKLQNLDAALTAALSDTSVQVVVQGEASAIKKLKTSDIYAYVNVEDTRFNARTGSILPYANESGVTVKARVLSGNKKLQIVSVTPDKVNIRFTVKPDYIKKSE